MDEGDHPGKKRRLQNACDECRRKKIRCDSATAPENICSRCLTMKLECTHHLQKRKRGPKVGPREYSARVLVSDILSVSTPYVVPDGADTVKEILVELAKYARSLERQLALAGGFSSEVEMPSKRAHHPITSNDTLESGGEREVEDSIDSLAQELGEVTIGTKHERRYGYGKSSHILLVESAVDTRRDVLGGPGRALLGHAVFTKFQRPHLWKPLPVRVISWSPIRELITTQRQEPVELQNIDFSFPEDDLLYDLINLYFTRVNPVFPLLHRPTFERLMADGLHLRDQSFGATLLAVCAFGSRHSNDPRTLYEGLPSEHGRGWKYFQQIPLMRVSLLYRPSLYDVQLFTLYVYYLQGIVSPDCSQWMLTGVGIRAAQAIGMHRKSIDHSNAIEYELWKRAFRLLVSIDLIMSATDGGPRAITPENFDVDVDPLIECDDEYWSVSDSGELFVQPQGQPSVSSFFVTFLKLLDILDLVQRTLYSSKKSEVWSKIGTSRNDWKQKAVIELDSALNKFLDQIPDHLKWSSGIPDAVFFQQSAMLYSMYYWVQIQVHRPFIPRPGHQAVLPFPSLAICSNAARTIIRIVETLEARRDNGMLTLEMLTNITIALFSAALILLVSIRRPHQTPKALLESEKDMASVHQCLKIMNKYEKRRVSLRSYPLRLAKALLHRYAAAGCVADMLNAVIAVGQVSQDTTSSRIPGSDTKNQVVPSSSRLRYPESRAGAGGNYTQEHYVQDTTDLPINTLFSTDGLSNDNPLWSSSSQHFPLTVNPVDLVMVHPRHTHAVVNSIEIPQDPAGVGTDPFSMSDTALAPDNTAPLYNPDPTRFPVPGPSTSHEFNEQDWDSFMASIDDILATAAEYRAP